MGVFDYELPKNNLYNQIECISNFDIEKLNLDTSKNLINKIIQSSEKELDLHNKNITLISASSIEKDVKSNSKTNKSELSKLVAKKSAKKALEKKITKIFFDRGIYKYHGRVKIFAETLRENGMEF